MTFDWRNLKVTYTGIFAGFFMSKGGEE